MRNRTSCKVPDIPALFTRPTEPQAAAFILPFKSVGCFAPCYPLSFVSFAITRPSDARATTPRYDTPESWCAVHSSALIDGAKWLPVCSWNAVAAHLSMGVTEQHHRQSNAISRTHLSACRRQDSVRSVVLVLHQASSAVAEFRCWRV